MLDFLTLIAVGLAGVRCASANPYSFPEPTTTGTDVYDGNGFSPRPTEGPSFAKYENPLQKRLQYVPITVCGWQSGGGYNSQWYAYTSTSTCFWNSDVKIVGAGGPPWYTSCVNNKDTSTFACSTCSGSVTLCGTDYPYCGTAFFGSDYSAFFCSTIPAVTSYYESTYSGQTDILAFPIFTGKKGISTGTAIPDGFTGTTGAASSTSSSPSTTTGPSTTTTTPPATSSAAPGKKVPIGPIVGGVIGGLALIAIAITAIAILMLRRRKQKKDPNHAAQTQPLQQGYHDPHMSQAYPQQGWQQPPPGPYSPGYGQQPYDPAKGGYTQGGYAGYPPQGQQPQYAEAAPPQHHAAVELGGDSVPRK